MTERNPILPLLLTAAGLLFSACIRDDVPPCPPLRVEFEVVDKNYANIDDVEAIGLDRRVDESQPFAAYVATLSYRITDEATGRVVAEQHLWRPAADEAVPAVELPADLPFGTYRITAWGGMADEQGIEAAGTFGAYALHHGGTEGYDVYQAEALMHYDATHARFAVGLRRVKGKLLVESVGLPEDVCRSERRVDGVAAGVTSALAYSGTTALSVQEAWQPAPRVVTDTWAAPSFDARPATLTVSYYDSPERTAPVLCPPATSIDLRRNEISVVRYVYTGGDFEVYVLVDDAWNRVNDLIVD